MPKHALLSASASKQWLNCPPSAKFCATQDDRASPYAQQGRDAHSLCEYKVLTRVCGKDDFIENKEDKKNMNNISSVITNNAGGKSYISHSKVITRNDTRWSYANIRKAKAVKGGNSKHSISFSIPKDDAAVINEIQAAYKKALLKLQGKGWFVPYIAAIEKQSNH